MFHIFIKQVTTSLFFLILMTLLLGLVYPGVVTLLAQTLFPDQANGSLIYEDNKIKGSALIGQAFKGEKYFWSRPSATSPYPYNALASSGSNLNLINPVLLKNFEERIASLKRHPHHKENIPIDLITSSGSGLDPDISPDAAYFQAQRVAYARGLSKGKVLKLIDKNITKRQFGFLGEPRVNVLKLNLALDRIYK